MHKLSTFLRKRVGTDIGRKQKKQVVYVSYFEPVKQNVFFVSLFSKHISKLLFPVSLFPKQRMAVLVSCFEMETEKLDPTVSCQSLGG